MRLFILQKFTNLTDFAMIFSVFLAKFNIHFHFEHIYIPRKSSSLKKRVELFHRKNFSHRNVSCNVSRANSSLLDKWADSASSNVNGMILSLNFSKRGCNRILSQINGFRIVWKCVRVDSSMKNLSTMSYNSLRWISKESTSKPSWIRTPIFGTLEPTRNLGGQVWFVGDGGKHDVLMGCSGSWIKWGSKMWISWESASSKLLPAEKNERSHFLKILENFR